MIPEYEIKNRLKKIRELMEFDAMLISKPKNLFYISGAECSSALLTQDSCVLFTCKLNYDEINDSKIFDAEIYKKDSVKAYINKLKPEKLGIENVCVNSYKNLKKNTYSEIIVSGVVEEARMVKSGYEIDALKKSAEIAKKGMEKAYEIISPGISEIAAAAEIEYEIRKNGSETPPFEHGLLVSSGKNAGKIHGFPMQKKINAGDLVVVDLGARYKNYYSDMTRTIPAGKLKQNSEEKKVYEFIKNLQQEAIDMIKPGIRASEIHKFTEEKIKKSGYELYHGTGHGIGLDIHEIPHLNNISETLLSKNMVFTVEPGIYVPGKFGVRFEDMILLTGKGCRILT